MEINLIESQEDWKCEVILRNDYTYDSRARKFPRDWIGPWQPHDTSGRVPFAVIEDKRELTDVLKRAQHAILSPDQDHEVIKPETPSNF